MSPATFSFLFIQLLKAAAMGTESSAADPRLPYELERVIFEIAAVSRPTSIPNLMLTAWRVKDW
jgi:hypothetical protein